MAALPPVLLGPLLRRVDARYVCVFIALSQPADVTVTVFAGRAQSTGPGAANAPSVGTQTRSTRVCGANLHAVVVDVEVPGLAPLTRYSYDVVVSAGGQTKGLLALGMLSDGQAAGGAPKPLALGYADAMLPTFGTPASDISDVRVAHASCRKSNGPGSDALAWLDDRIEDGLSDLDKAPQMLFLTGDQIYADDVGAVLLPMLSDVGKDLVGLEKFSVGNGTVDATYANFPAMRRQNTVRKLAQFTTTDGGSHLLTYGEFAAMYCAAFSPNVWRTLKKPEDIFTAKPAGADATFLTDWESKYTNVEAWKSEKNKAGRSHLDDVTDEAKQVEEWRDAVPRVARALANVPTYMIFDDHEITDDWYISDRWRERVIASRFGRAVIRNGLLAYTVFQGWGNDPAKFRHDDPDHNHPLPDAEKHPNEKLLDILTEFATSLANPTAATYDKVDALIGLDKPVSPPKVEYHYQIPGPKFMVRVLDTRTRRTYRAKGNTPPKLLGDSLDWQLPKGPFTDGRELLLVISASPVLFPRLFESMLQPVSALVFDMKAHMFGREDDTVPGKITGLNGSEDKDIEGWRSDEEHHEQFLRRLGTYRRVVTLGGDVHFASTLFLDMWTKGDDVLDSRIVNCTSSAARNQPAEGMRGILRTLRIGQALLRGTPAERLGWDGDHGVVLPAGASIRPGRRARLRRKPTILPAQGWPAGTTVAVDKQPDWRWRVQVVRDERTKAELPAGAPDIPVLTWNPGDRPSSDADIAGRHQQLTLAPKDPVRLMVFRNNVGLVSFANDGSDYRISHTLLSNADTETGDGYTEHTVPFAPTPAPAPPVLGTA
jgi:hypothetical protein